MSWSDCDWWVSLYSVGTFGGSSGVFQPEGEKQFLTAEPRCATLRHAAHVMLRADVFVREIVIQA